MLSWLWWVAVYIIIPVSGLGQLLRLAPLPYKTCQPQRIWVNEADSLRKQVVIDSMTRLLLGRWQLVEAGAGACFVPPYAPDQYTEMVLNSQGKGVVYQGGKLLTTVQLRFVFYWNQLRFLMEETRNPAYFEFLPSSLDRRIERRRRVNDPYAHVYRNVIQICEETLHMYGSRTGLDFVFKRLPARYGPEP